MVYKKVLSNFKQKAATLAAALLLCMFFAAAWADTALAAEEILDGTHTEDTAQSWRYSQGNVIANPCTDSSGSDQTQETDSGTVLKAAAALASSSSAYSSWTSSNGTTSYNIIFSSATVKVTVSGVARVGIDVSKWNGDIDWEKVAASGITYAIIRCGYGSDFEEQDDEYFLENVEGALAAGLDIGIYLYSYATGTSGSDYSASSEAAHVLRLLEEAGLDPEDLALPVFLDMEDSTQQSLSASLLGDIAETFCNTLEQAGYSVGIYANKDWWENYLTDSAFDNESWYKWVARYPTSSSIKSTGVDGTDIWQVSSNGTVSGIDGNVDINFDYLGEGGYSLTGTLKYNSSTGQWGYYVGGVIDTSYTGFAENSYGTWYVKNGIVSLSYTGLATVDGTTYYVSNSLVSTATGLYQVNGTWYYFVDGAIASSYTGLVQNSSSWWYVQNGVVTLNYTGLVTNSYGTWYVSGSNVKFVTGLYNVNGTWYYILNGAVAYSYTGLVSNSAGTWYVENGIVDFGYTGLATVDGTTYYVSNSLVSTATGLYQVNGTWYFFLEGAVASSYSGIIKNSSGWWYVENGVVAFDYTGLATNEYGTWYFENSSLKFVTGLYYIDGTWYYILNGAVAYSYTGLASNSYGTWYVENGTVSLSYTGTVEINGVTYKIVNSKVVS